MTLPRKLLFTILSFLLVIIGVCIVNYLLQIVAIFLDIFDRHLTSSGAFIIVLWIVSGIFTALFTFSAAQDFLGKEVYSSQYTAKIIIGISLVIIVFAIVLLSKGKFNGNPSEYSLILSNGYVLTSFFAGCGLTAFLFRNFESGK